MTLSPGTYVKLFLNPLLSQTVGGSIEGERSVTNHCDSIHCLITPVIYSLFFALMLTSHIVPCVR